MYWWSYHLFLYRDLDLTDPSLERRQWTSHCTRWLEKTRSYRGRQFTPIITNRGVFQQFSPFSHCTLVPDHIPFVMYHEQFICTTTREQDFSTRRTYYKSSTIKHDVVCELLRRKNTRGPTMGLQDNTVTWSLGASILNDDLSDRRDVRLKTFLW